MKEKLSLVPNKPGCYLMKNSDGVIIYVGKAKNLKNRLASYFRGKHTGKTEKLVSEIVDFEYIVVATETESLVLELNLIKTHDPKYNILLRDDKSYPYIELTRESVPKLNVIRTLSRKKHSKNYLFGPYPNVTAASTVVNMINRLYPLRKCRTYEKRPCLYYHIGQCLGYCNKEIDPEVIKNMKNEILSFLRGNDKIITDKITEQMNAEIELLNFEKAKELKDLLDSISYILKKQKVELSDLLDRDIFSYYTKNGYISIQVLFIRGGKILERHNKIFPIVDEEEEEFKKYIIKMYEKNILKPHEIIIPNTIDDELLKDYLKIKITKPIKGVKAKLIEMASDNAQIALTNKFELIKRDEARTFEANEELRNVLKLDKLDRIEIFDNAHLFGSYNVSGMVVYVSGKPSKNDYRKYKISVDQNDDYGTMREVVYRRYYKVLVEDLKKPDLIIADGGVGQINAVKKVLSDFFLNIPVMGLKKNNKHITEAIIFNNQEIEIDKKSNLFHYLMRMQDEVHNFTISYHKQLRSKGALESILESVEGIGNKRKTELLKKYKTITKLKSLTLEELSKEIPKNAAINLYDFLKNYE